jgi:hypothetical protein
VRPSDDEAREASRPLLGGALFSLSTACASLAGARRLSLDMSVLYIVLVGLAGWTVKLIWANNFDNLLAMFYQG